MRNPLNTLLTNAPRLMKLSFPRDDGPDAVLLVNQLAADEGLSRDFEYTVTILSDDPDIAFKDVQCRMVCVELTRANGSVRYFNGYCHEFRRLGYRNSLATYQMVLRPWLAFFKFRIDHFIFHNKNIEAQTREIFLDSGLSSFEFRTHGNDPLRTFSVQYGESDYNYLHRRWEELGWSYWYEHSERGHKLIICDATTTAEPVDGNPIIAWHHDGGDNLTDKITEWQPARQLVAGKVAYSNYDFKTPTPQRLSETSDIEQGEVHKIEVYRYQGLYGYKDAAHGSKIAERHLEQIESQGKHFAGSGDARTMAPGRWFTLTHDHADGGFGEEAAADMDFLILSAKHVIHNNLLSGEGTHAQYQNQFTCLRRKIPWRPAQGHNSEPVRVPGSDTATVVGPPGEEIHTDKFGRIKVQFHWDREGKGDGTSSCWLRVMTPWANSNFGVISLPRIGSEVVVQFLHGDPDRPLVVGQLYNQRHMPPWTLPTHKTQSGILSRSSKGGTPEHANAFRFEDEKGHEEVWLHAEKNHRIEVEHDESHWVGHDRKRMVDHNENVTVHNNRSKRVDHHETIGIGLTLSRMVGLLRNTVVGLADLLVVGQTRTVSIGQNHQIDVGHTEQRKIGNTQITQVGEHLELVCGQAKIVLKSDGSIFLQGNKIEIKGSEQINADSTQIQLNCGAAQSAPAAPAPPPTETPAFDTKVFADPAKLADLAGSMGLGDKAGEVVGKILKALRK